MTHNNEERFFAAFNNRINNELDKCYHLSADDQKDYIATSENIIAFAQAGLFFAGLASAPFTFGLGLAAAGASIVIIKTGKMCVDAYIDSKHADQELPPDYLENQRNLQRLALFILLRQAATTFFMRYHYSIQNRLNGTNAEKLGQYVAYRLMKKLYAELSAHPHQLPPVDTLVDYFLSSIHSSGLFHTEEVTVEPTENTSPLRIAALSRKTAIKHFCARQRWIGLEGPDIKVYGAETTPFKDQFQSTTTREDWGYITIIADKQRTIPLAIDKEKFHELPLPALQIQPIVEKSLFPHAVTRQEIEDYKTAYQTDRSLTLNTYLSQLHQRPTVACCHNAELQHMVFIGDYSKVDFYAADLSDCDFSDANFHHANLCRAQLVRVRTNSGTNFQYLLADGSTWIGEPDNKLVIHADISHARLNGSTWKHCQIDTLAIQIGSEWGLAVLEDMTMADTQAEAFAKRLQDEHDDRVRYNSRVDTLETNLSTLAVTTSSAIADVEARLDNVVAEQKIRDSRQDIRIDAIAVTQNALLAAQDVLVSLQQHCITEVYTDDYRNKTETYIPLYVKSLFPIPTATPVLLTDYLYSIVSTMPQSGVYEPKFIFVSGGTGCGKTFGVTRFGEGINAMHSETHPWVFVPLDASTITDKNPNTFNTALDKVIEKTQKASLAQHPCIIHLSKLDLSNIAIDKFIRDCTAAAKIWTAPIVFIFTARDKYMEEAQKHLGQFIQEAPGNYLTCEIQSLIDQQIQDFFQLFPKQKLSALSQVYQEQNIIDLPSLARTPLMLAIMTGVLVDYSLTRKANKTMQRIDFYSATWQALFERVKYKLPDPYQDYSNFMQEMYNLAKAMLRSRVDSIVYNIPTPSPSLKKTAFQELLETKMGTLSPLSVSRKNTEQYVVRFIHPSLGYFLIAKILIENLLKIDFPNKETQQMWGRNYLLRTPEVLGFVIELLQQYPETTDSSQAKLTIVKQSSYDAFDATDDAAEEEMDIPHDRQHLQSRLLQLVRTTHKSNPGREENKKLASNAFTVLCKWGRDLSKEDFSGLILHFIDATNGLFSYTNFAETDLTGGCFYNAILFRANMANTILDQTRFLNATRFLEIGSTPRTFVVYRSLTDTIIAYPIAPNRNSKKYQLAVVKITGEQVQLLRCWPAHDQDITAMDLISQNGNTRFASVGLGATIRVWDLHSTSHPTEIAKLRGIRHRSPIEHLVWGPDGNLLATGCRAGYVRIWNVSQQTRLLKSAQHRSGIRALIWGKKTQVLIAAEDSNRLSVWYDALNNPALETIVVTHTTPIVAIHSLAFSIHETQLAIGTVRGDILILDMTTKRVTQTLTGHKSRVTSLLWYDELISSSQDQTIRVWPSDSTNGSIFQQDHPIGKVDILPNGQLISGIDADCSRLYFWDRTQPVYQSNYVEPLGFITCMSAHPIENYIAVGDAKGTVMIYPIQDIEQPDMPLLKPLFKHKQASIQYLNWSKNGLYLASIGQDQSIYLKNMQTSEPPILIKTISTGWITHFVWCTHPDKDQQLIIGFSDGSIEIYSQHTSFRSAVSVVPYESSTSIIWLAARTLSPQLAIAGAQQVMIYSLEPETRLVFEHPNRPAKMLIWSPNGTCLASTDESHTIYLWNIAPTTVTPTARYQATEIKCLIWTNQWIVLGNSKEILYWNITTGAELQHTVPTRIPLRTRLLCASSDNKIVAARATGILFFLNKDLNDGRQPEYPWQIRRLKAGFCAEGSDISGSEVLSNSTKSYLEKNGATTHLATSPSLSFLNFGTSSSASPRQNAVAVPELPLHLASSDLMRLFSSQQPRQPLSDRITANPGHDDSDSNLQAGGGSS